MLRVLKLYYKVASSQLPAPQIAPRTKVVLQSRQFSSSSSPDTPHTSCARKSPVLIFQLPNRTLACVSRTRHARSRQRVAPDRRESRSPLHFGRPTRTIYGEGCAGPGQIALSPAFRALDTHDLRRGLSRTGSNRTLACISRTRHARSPQTVAPDRFQIAFSPTFRAFDTHDLRRGLRRTNPNRTLACISRARHARSPQRVATDRDKSHSRLHFVRSARTISAEGCVSWCSGGTAPGLKRES